MNTPQPRTLVVVVNYRTPALVVDCLRSLEPEVRSCPGTTVAVVDNDSGDGSVERIQNAIAASGWASWACLLPSPTNGGFAYGNNHAIRPAMASTTPPDLVWLLNPDTVVRAGALGALVSFMNAHPNAGICGGGIEEANGVHWPFAFRFPSIPSEIESGMSIGPVTRLLSRWTVRRRMADEPTRVDWVPGATMMIRREVLDRVGLMDEQYFLYFEETDYCLQAQRAGFECWYVPDSRIMHIAGQSTAVTSKSDQPRRLPDYWFDSRRRYFIKNHGRLYAAALDVVWMLAFCVGRLRSWLLRRPNPWPPHFLSDFFRHCALVRSDIGGNARIANHGGHPTNQPRSAAVQTTKTS